MTEVVSIEMLRRELESLRDAIDAYCTLADYASKYRERHGWMELDACRHILGRRQDELRIEVDKFVEANGDNDTMADELILLQMSADDAFRPR